MTTWEKLKEREANVDKIPDIDREILSYLKVINSLPRVMTGVSCAGHPEEECSGRKGATTSPTFKFSLKTSMRELILLGKFTDKEYQ